MQLVRNHCDCCLQLCVHRFHGLRDHPGFLDTLPLSQQLKSRPFTPLCNFQDSHRRSRSESFNHALGSVKRICLQHLLTESICGAFVQRSYCIERIGVLGNSRLRIAQSHISHQAPIKNSTSLNSATWRISNFSARAH